MYYHAAWFTTPHHKEGFEAFLDTIVAMDDVWLVTNWQAIQWVRDPTPLDRIKSFKPFNCDYPVSHQIGSFYVPIYTFELCHRRGQNGVTRPRFAMHGTSLAFATCAPANPVRKSSLGPEKPVLRIHSSIIMERTKWLREQIRTICIL